MDDSNTSRCRPPQVSAVDNYAGIIPLVVESENERSDPEVFVVAGRISDAQKYGIPTAVIGSGSGAGLDFRSAFMAATGECLERYALSIIHPEDLIFGSYQKLSNEGYNIVSPKTWSLYDKSQYDSIAFAPFYDDTPISWVCAQSITSKNIKLVPASMVYIPYEFFFPKEDEKIVTVAISTGAACATSYAEALLKGVCEIIERDAFMIAWRNRLNLPRVKIDANSSIYSVYQNKLSRSGLEYVIVSTTLDLGVPSFFGFVIDNRSEPPGIVAGGACHPDPSQAVLKTLLELVQGLKWKDYVEHKPTNVEQGFSNIRSFEDRVRLYAFNDMRHSFEFILETKEVPLSMIPSFDCGSHRSNLDNCISILRKHELEVLALDLTPIDIQQCGYVITKVLAPGCEIMEGDHMMPFLGGRRWREVPFRLGLRSVIPEIESVNPYPHPYP